MRTFRSEARRLIPEYGAGKPAMDRLSEWLRWLLFASGNLKRRHRTGKRIADTAAESGLYFEIVERRSVGAGVNAVRQLLPQMWFDEARCAEGL